MKVRPPLDTAKKLNPQKIVVVYGHGGDLVQEHFSGDSTLNWAAALSMALTLKEGECGLSDGSAEGDWRLPNVRELDSLVHDGVSNPAFSNTSSVV